MSLSDGAMGIGMIAGGLGEHLCPTDTRAPAPLVWSIGLHVWDQINLAGAGDGGRAGGGRTDGDRDQPSNLVHCAICGCVRVSFLMCFFTDGE